MTTTITGGTLPWATKPPPTTLPPAPTNERLSFAVDQFTGSGHTDYATTKRPHKPSAEPPPAPNQLH
ncbi:hypothetical protein NIIDMKKI_30420 [Mycobacterium kansasii]|uniref:Uncharacterized protein n=3 Tax=Mycobacterium kansasii TaxID=1768 RepID=A0A7G1IA06_MYCKA|nr:hypothetical protein NIIDMKKI_30420 [Mycobacterium kansasii]